MTKHEQFLARAGTVAGVGLALAGAAVFLVFVRFLYADLSGQRQFSTWPQILLHYVVPACLAVLLLASLKLTPIHRVRVLMSCMAFTASSYAAELFLVSSKASLQPMMTLLHQSSDKSKFAAALTRDFGTHIDIRSSEEVVSDLRQNGVDAVAIATPQNHLFVNQSDGSIKSAINIDGREVIPLAGVSNKVTVLCNENGQWIDYRSDHRGFNNPDEVWQLGRLSIAALGDSFTHGYCVERDRNFVAVIRQRYRATLNLGVAGHGPLLTLATLQEHLPRFRPPIVLWFYCEGNDLTGLQTERRSALLRNYLKDDFTQSVLANQRDLDRAIESEMSRLRAESQRNARPASTYGFDVLAFAKLTAFRGSLSLISETDADDLEMGVDLETQNMDAFREILHRARARVGAWGGQLYFVYLPEWTRYTRYQSWGKTQRDAVLTLVRSLDIPIIDIDPVFRSTGDPLALFPFREIGHYNETGHRLVAEEVLGTLQSAHRAGQN